MKILLVNKYHYMRGGDCIHTFALSDLLQKHGNDVRHFSMHHPKNLKYEHEDDFVSHIDYKDELSKGGIKSKVNAVSRMLYSKEARSKISKVIGEFKPDVIHIHNIHKHLTTSIVLEANKLNIPIIWTLHDYNLICPNILFLSKGEVCERCKNLKYVSPVLRRCSNGSLSASAIIAIEQLLHDFQGIKKRISFFIAPSEFLKNKFVEYGFNDSKIKVLPNFYDGKSSSKSKSEDKYFLYFGRLSSEKGVKTLCEAARLSKLKLVVAGTGPLKESLEKEFTCDNINFVGFKSGNELLKLRKNAWFTITPSECYENNPLAVIESLTDGVPVIGANIGGIPELVIDKKTGFSFESRNVEDLKIVLNKAWKLSRLKRDQLGQNGKVNIGENNNPNKYYNKLIEIYEEAQKCKR